MLKASWRLPSKRPCKRQEYRLDPKVLARLCRIEGPMPSSSCSGLTFLSAMYSRDRGKTTWNMSNTLFRASYFRNTLSCWWKDSLSNKILTKSDEYITGNRQFLQRYIGKFKSNQRFSNFSVQANCICCSSSKACLWISTVACLPKYLVWIEIYYGFLRIYGLLVAILWLK